MIFNWWPTTPTYHAFNDDRLNERSSEGVYDDWTICGRMVSQYTSGEPGSFRKKGDWLPLKHAEKFGRPCKVCFL